MQKANVTADLVLRAINLYWDTAPYHLRLVLVDAAIICTMRDDVERMRLVAAIRDLPCSSNVLLSSEITRALVHLGDLEDFEDGYVSTVEEQIRRCLDEPNSAERCKLAINLYAGQFEDILGSAHIQAIEQLGIVDRKVFLGMAATGATDEPIIRVPLLIELGSLCDSGDGRWFARWTGPVRIDEVMLGDGIAVFVTAHIIMARLRCGLPKDQGIADFQGSRELDACGKILYWRNRLDLSGAMRQRECGKALSILVQDKSCVSLDVIRRCEHQHISNLDRLPGTENIITSILNSFPEEVVQICRRSLAEPSRLITYYPALAQSDRRKNLIFAINVIGLYGNSTDLPMLRDTANDPDLGSSAIEAVRALDDRLASSWSNFHLQGH